MLARHADGLRPARPAPPPASGRWPARPSSRPAAPPCGPCTVAPEVLGYVVDLARATRAVAVAVARRLAARRHRAARAARAWAWLSGRDYVTPDDVKALARPALRHRVAAAAEAELEGVTADARARRRARLGPGPPLTARRPVALTGRRRAAGPGRRRSSVGRWSPSGLAVLGVLAAARARCRRASTSRWPGSVRGAAAAARRATPAVRLGEPATVDAARHQPRPAAGARPCCATRGRRRAGAVDARGTASTSRPASAAGSTTALRPTRRGDRPADRVTVRSLGPLGLAARQGSHEVPWRRARAAAVRLPPAPARRLARLRELDGRSRRDGARPGHRVRLAARVRRRRRRPLDRLAGHRPARPTCGAHLASRARPAGAARARHRAHRPRPGSATRPGWTPRWTPRCCSPRSPPAPATGSTCSPSTGGSARRVEGAAATGAAARAGRRRWRRSSRSWSRPTTPGWSRRCCAGRPPALPGRAAHRARPGARRGGPAARARRRSPRRHQVVLASVADPRVAAMAARPRRRRGGLRRRRGRAGRRRAARGSRSVLRRRGVEVVDAPPDELPPRLADRYLALKAAGRL